MSKKNIIITGGGSGIGREIALNLSKNNNVIICGRTLSKLKEVQSISKNIIIYKCNASNEKEVKKFKNFISKKFKKIDILINNAAEIGEIGKFNFTNTKKWFSTVENNLLSTYLFCKIFYSLLKKSKTKKIINFAGGGAFENFCHFSAYAVSKTANVRFTEIIAEELFNEGFKIHGIAPGFVITPIHNKVIDAGEKKVGKYYEFVQNKINKGSIPLQVVVECLQFLISDKSNNLNGKTISASFDNWKNKDFQKLTKDIQKTDLFNLRRINILNLDNYNLLNKLKKIKANDKK